MSATASPPAKKRASCVAEPGPAAALPNGLERLSQQVNHCRCPLGAAHGKRAEVPLGSARRAAWLPTLSRTAPGGSGAER